MNHIDNAYNNLATCKQIARVCRYDTVICKDGKRSNGAKYFFAGRFRDLCQDMYNTHMYDRCFYEVIPSTPLWNPIGYVAGTGVLPGEDLGFCGARFIVDVDFSISQDQVEKHLQSFASLLETAYKAAKPALPGDADCRIKAKINSGLVRMKELLYSLFQNDSWEEIVSRFRKSAIKWMQNGLRSLGFSDDEIEVHVLDASCLSPASQGHSKKMKFSLHLHFNKILLRQHAVDGAILARTLNSVMAGTVLHQCMDEYPKSDDFWIRCILLRVPDGPEACIENIVFSRRRISQMGIIDEAIYSENRVMRIWQSSKKGQDRPLTRVDENGLCIEKRNITLQTFLSGMDDFRISHVPGKRKENGDFFKGTMLQVQRKFPPMPPSCLDRLRSRRATASPDNTGVEWKLRELCEDVLVSTWDLFKFNDTVQDISNNVSLDSRNRDRIPRTSDRPSSRRILYGTMNIYNDGGDPVKASEIVESVRYHCPTCDCFPRNEVVDECKQSGAPDGNPSARCVVTSDLNLALYCFSCQHLQIVQQIVNYGGFDNSCSTVKVVEAVGGRYFPTSAIEPICAGSLSGNALPTMVAVNAGMGSGKTHAANEISNLQFVNRLLVVTHRKSLARALAIKFGAVCYLDLPKDACLLDTRRLVICANSLWRIKEASRYDLIVIDEAGFVRRHFAGQTFSKNRDPTIAYARQNIVAVLSGYMRIAPCILLLQDGLSHDDVQFYSVLRKNDRRVHKYYLPRQNRPDRYKTVDNFYDWLCELHHTVLNLKKKTFVACSLAADAVTLYTFFKECGANLRVAMICGDHVEPQEIQKAERFVDHYREFDLCIATSAMETGVSLEGHYTDVFALYRPCPISHSSQIQLVNRVRNSQRTIIFASKGRSFLHRTTINLLKRDWHVRETATNNPTNRGGFVMDLGVLDDALCSALLAKIVEDADAKNNNRQLWGLHQNAKVMDDFNFDRTKRVFIGKSFFEVASKNSKLYISELREMDMYMMQSDLCKDILSPPPDDQGSELNGSFSEDVMKRYTEKRLIMAREYIYSHVLQVMQALQRVAENKKQRSNLNKEKDMTGMAMKNSRFSRRAFILFALIDHCAAIQACGDDEIKIAEIKKRSYWSAIESWITSHPPTNDEQSQLELQCVLEVLQALHIVQVMYGTFFPAQGMYMLLSPEKVMSLVNALENWAPPKEITRCAQHTLASSREACRKDRADIAIVQNSTFKPPHRRGQGVRKGRGSKEKKPPKLGKSIRGFVSARVPIAWEVYKRESTDAAIIAPWCISTLALIACGMNLSWLPADQEALKDCDWFFFKGIENLEKQCRQYIRPENNPNVAVEENALRSVIDQIDLLRSQLHQVYRMKLKRDEKCFSNVTTNI